MQDEIYILREELAESNQILHELDKEIEKLKSKGKGIGHNIRSYYQNNKKKIKENRQLLRAHNDNLLDIKEYKFQLIELQKKLQIQNSEMQSLEKSNAILKQKLIKKREASKSPKRQRIKGVSDLRKSFGFHLKEVAKFGNKKDEEKIDEENEEGIEENPSLDKEKKQSEFEKLKRLKFDCETIFRALQNKITSYYKETDNQQTYITNYRNYINTINNQIRSFRQQLRISVVGEIGLNVEDLSGGKVNQLTKDMESTTNIINQVNDFIYTIKNRTLKKGENILRNIHDKLLEIDRRKNLTYWFLSNRMDAIINNIEDLKKLCQVLQRSLSDTTTQRKQIENNISNLKLNMEKFMNNHKDDKKKINDAIRKTIRKTGKNLFNSIHKIGTKYVIYTMIMICMTLILKLKQ
jgi:chromosome segregation ATPase